MWALLFVLGNASAAAAAAAAKSLQSPRSKCLLISWLQSPSTVILEPQKIKSDTVSTVSPSISHEVMGPSLEGMMLRLKLQYFGHLM